MTKQELEDEVKRLEGLILGAEDRMQSAERLATERGARLQHIELELGREIQKRTDLEDKVREMKSIPAVQLDFGEALNLSSIDVDVFVGLLYRVLRQQVTMHGAGQELRSWWSAKTEGSKKEMATAVLERAERMKLVSEALYQDFVSASVDYR
jgi:hypothetical protein